MEAAAREPHPSRQQRRWQKPGGRFDRDRPLVSDARAALQSAAESCLAAARDSLLLRLRGHAHKAAGDEEQQLDDALDALDYGPLHDAAADAAKKVASDAAKLGLEQVTTPIDTMLSQANERAVKWAEQRAGELIKGVEETTRDRVKATVAQGLDEGKTNAEIADILEENDAFSSTRAETIARTETAAADVAGNIIGWQESGVVEGKEWIVADAGECDLCQAYAGTIVPLDEEFEEGDPPLHPNCRCDVLPVLKDDEEE